MMYAVSIGSNFQQQTAFAEARIALGALGACQFSDCFELPDRDGSTDVFWNMAVYRLSRPVVEFVHLDMSD
jgi:hypothetical protein